MSLENKGFEFGEFFLDSEEQLLKRNGEPVPLTPKSYDLLLELVKHSGHTLSKDSLMDSVWAGSIVEDGNLTFTIGMLRKALGDDAGHPHFIETIPRRGYRFVAEVRGISGEKTSSQVNGYHVEEKITENGSGNISQPQPSGELLKQAPSQKFRYVFFGALTLTVLTLAAAFWGLASKIRFESEKRRAIHAVTSNGETTFPSLSPDGKFLAYVLDKGDKQSLWLRDIATESDIRLTPEDTHETINAVTFGPDGEYIFYLSSSRLNRIPILGGKPELILDDVSGETNVTVSPDGKHVAFLRSSANGNENDLIVANMEDRSERILAASQRPRHFYSRVAWSPDGKSIACAKWGVAGEGLAITVLRADDGTEIQKFRMVEVVLDLIWKYDGTALLAAACHYQICRVLQYDLSSGNVTPLTDDLVNYTSLSMASDGSRLFAVREDAATNLWILPVGNDLPAKQITTGFDRFDGLSSLTWVTTGDRLVFDAQPGEKGETDSIRVDGSNQNQITKNYVADGTSPDGRYLVLRPFHEVVPVIRVYDTMNGSSKPITTGNLDVNHAVSPDGQWTAFARVSDDVSIWKVSMSGGEAIRLTVDPGRTLWPAISHDGRFVAFYRRYVNTGGKSTADIAYVDSNGGHDIKRFAVDAQLLPTGKTAPQWSSDGKSIYFVRLRDGASNIWKQPVEGSEPTQVTYLKSGRIYNFTFSPDERQIALSYSPFSRDVVQINYR